MTDSERFNRNTLLFGAEGQARLSKCHVAVVGLGGLGSHVAQQLAYLGFGKLTFVDHDHVALTNLNRLVGATEEDSFKKTPKVRLMKRVAESILPSADVSAIDARVQDVTAQEELSRVNIVVGCLDDDTGRLFLTTFCSERGLPYIDLATDIGGADQKPWYGGRVFFSNGDGCLICMQLLDQRQIARASMSPEQIEQEARIYGVPSSSLLENVGPAVVSINGVVASLGVTELLVWATKLRSPYRLLTYRGDLGRVSVSVDEPPADCFYCSVFRENRQLN